MFFFLLIKAFEGGSLTSADRVLCSPASSVSEDAGKLKFRRQVRPFSMIRGIPGSHLFPHFFCLMKSYRKVEQGLPWGEKLSHSWLPV